MALDLANLNFCPLGVMPLNNGSPDVQLQVSISSPDLPPYVISSPIRIKKMKKEENESNLKSLTPQVDEMIRESVESKVQEQVR